MRSVNHEERFLIGSLVQLLNGDCNKEAEDVFRIMESDQPEEVDLCTVFDEVTSLVGDIDASSSPGGMVVNAFWSRAQDPTRFGKYPKGSLERLRNMLEGIALPTS